MQTNLNFPLPVIIEPNKKYRIKRHNGDFVEVEVLCTEGGRLLVSFYEDGKKKGKKVNKIDFQLWNTTDPQQLTRADQNTNSGSLELPPNDESKMRKKAKLSKHL
uniref:DUF3553 domain-containing protein n=1 Tax=Rhabditophanes sp. KR3021 TaxID=114890 RepID=A0AC35UBD9_9BILA